MSLGWQTESALMPNKAKPIHVDSRSMLGLKAVIYQQEQQLKLKTASTASSSSSSNKTYHRHIRSNNSHTSKSDEGDMFNDRRSKQQKQRGDGGDEEVLDEDRRAQQALEAKAKLYEDIMTKGDVSTTNASLVDFEKKQTRSEDVDDGCAMSSRSDSPVHKTVLVSSEYGPQQWQWSNKSSSDTTNPNTAYLSERAAERQFQKEVERQMEREKATEVHRQARVTTQWERTLNSSARDYLQQIHEETQVNRSNTIIKQTNGEGVIKSAREEKLEMLKRKREQMSQM